MDLAKQEKISVLVVNYNQQKELNALISLLKPFLRGLNYEVIVFDASNNFKAKNDVKYYSLSKNVGYGTAINYLATKASGDHFLILNPDIELNGFLKPDFQKYLESDLKTVVISLGKAEKQYSVPLIAHFKGKKRFSGFSFLIASHAFKQLGGFDNSYFMYFEDDDLNIKLKRFGLKTMYLDKPLITHNKTYKNKTFKTRKKYYYDSQLIFLRKNHKIFYLLFYIPNRILSFLASV